MPIYVDEPFDTTAAQQHYMSAHAKRNGYAYCHMWCDPGDEQALHNLAASIGLRCEWYNCSDMCNPHYDCIPSERRRAIRAGAIVMSYREWLRMRGGNPRDLEVDVVNHV